MTNQPEPAELLPAESMCVLALARLAGRHDWTEVAA